MAKLLSILVMMSTSWASPPIEEPKMQTVFKAVEKKAVWKFKDKAVTVTGDITNQSEDVVEAVVKPAEEKAMALNPAPSLARRLQVASTTTLSMTSTLTTTQATLTGTSSMTSTLTTTQVHANCSLQRMICPVPAHLSGGNYSIRGNEGSQGACGIQGEGNALFFDIQFNQCNVTSVGDASRVITTATLVPVFRAISGISFLDEQNWPVITCRCEVHTVASNVSSSALVQVGNAVPQNLDVSVTGESLFQPVLRLFSSDAFDIAISAEQVFPDVSSRFYLEAVSGDSQDIIGFVNCTSSPTNMSSDPFVQPLLQASCPVDPMGWQSHDHNGSNRARASLRKFAFVSSERVFISCAIVRCRELPCGVCSNASAPAGGRRLDDEQVAPRHDLWQRSRGGRRTAAVEETMLSLQLGAGPVQFILPAAVPVQLLTSVLDRARELPRTLMQSDQQKLYILEGNLTLYIHGYEMHNTTTFERTLQEIIAKLARAPVELVRLNQISISLADRHATSSTQARRTRQANASASLEAAVSRFSIIAAQRDLLIQALSHSSSVMKNLSENHFFLLELAEELGLPLIGANAVRMELGEVMPIARSAFVVTEPETGVDGNSTHKIDKPTEQFPAEAAIIAAVGVAVALVILCALLGLCLMRKLRASHANKGNANPEAGTAASPTPPPPNEEECETWNFSSDLKNAVQIDGLPPNDVLPTDPAAGARRMCRL